MIRPLPLLLSLQAVPAAAQPAPADLAEIDRAVSAFAGQDAPPVDRRLRLARCPSALALDWFGGARQSVRVACPVPGGWTLYVPLAAAPAQAQPPLIQRGDAVTIMVGGAGFAVSQPGEALEAGAAGAWIKVRGLGAKAPVLRGQVLRPGVIALAVP